jgi:hypothetical protein
MVRLGTEDYLAYEAIVRRVCWALGRWYAGTDDAARQDEVQATAPLIARFARSLDLLVFRHKHSRAHDLTLDFLDGGFPHLYSIRELSGDYQIAAATLNEGETRADIREQILHEIFGKARDPVELVWAFAERVYTRRLCEADQPVPFLPFSMGDLTCEGPLPNGRTSYRVTWGCYDSVTNLPHFHHMCFEWSGSRPLEEDGTLLKLFHTTLRAEGGRVPVIGLLSNMIDRDLPQVHPKRLVRARIGPLRTAKFSRESSPLVEALRRFGEDDDFALEVLVEGVESQGEFEDKPKTLLERVTGGQILQRLLVRRDDPECEKALASYVYRRLLLPHSVRQSLGKEDPALRGFENAGQIRTFDRRNVYVS